MCKQEVWGVGLESSGKGRKQRGKCEKGLKLPPSLAAQAEELLSISV